MSKPVDDERLLAVAGSISDGMPVDWEAVRRRFADSEAAPVVEELQLLHGLAAVHAEAASWGPLHVIDALGHGSFATVYRAFDRDLQREVALKIAVAPDGAAFDPQLAVREARLLARVRHPNVVAVFGAQRKDDAVALAMELIKGRTLDELVRKQGPFSAREAAVIGLDLCRALAAVHEAGLLHGDIKAHNVMREEGGRIVLMDFGTGKDLEAPVHARGDFAGTPLYLAPEVFAGRPRTKASDIYSLGILLFYLSTGAYPVEGDTRTEIDRRHLQPGTRRRLRDVRPDLPTPFIGAVERAVAEDPSQRYQTAGEFEAALVGTLEQQPEPNPWWRRPSPLAIAAALLVAVGLTGTGLYLGFGGESGNAAREAKPTNPAPSSAAPVAAADGAYNVDAAMYRAGAGGAKRLLRSDRLAPGDQLFLQVKTSAPAHVYVVNEDDRGAAHVLFPLPGQSSSLSASAVHKLPGTYKGEEKHWVVDSPGEREHFVIFVSPTAVPEVEEIVSALPAPREGAPITYASLDSGVILKLRGVGGLAAAPTTKPQSRRLSDQYTIPLSDGPEEARGLWVRQIAFENPGRR